MARASAGVTSNGVIPRVDDHEIIAEAMHLVEVAPHWPRLRERPCPSPPHESQNMQRAATDVMQSILFSAVLDAIAALKAASGGLPNQSAARRPGDPRQCHLRRPAQGGAGRDRRQHPHRLHPIVEGGLCGRAQAADAAQSRPIDRVPERERRGRRGRRAGPPTGHRPRRAPAAQGPAAPAVAAMDRRAGGQPASRG